ncbi:sugar phosphate isomerase/epimerase [Falsirhodobacter sp. alg1]|uniref:sugar phosphate isomerase/epimerase family protein n=1 Tax=Falsirhodobacter sp. alg1 TaxID=1472418 RepID=UPI0005F0A6E6|nr:sugar phosphate isomerase/epimerase family protein [Falsirhodobacter sp. alg1]
MTDLPLLGAAMPVSTLATLQGFILEQNRDLELQDFITVDLLNGGWRERADEARALLQGYEGRLGIHGPFWGLNISNPDPDIRTIVTGRLMQGLEVCDHLGATQMVVHSPFTAWDNNNLDNQPDALERIHALAHETLRGPVEYAAAIGATMVIENIDDMNPDLRAALADSFGSAQIALSVDTGHAHYAHGTNGAPPVDYFVRRAGKRLQHIHLQDADGHADRHWAIGHGNILWASVFSALAELTSKPRLILELRDKAGILPSVKYLNDLGLAR